MKEKDFKEFYENDILVLDDCVMEVNEDPYANVEKCIHTLISQDDCNPLEFKCNGLCNGGGICFFNPLSECYNMSLEDYKCYLTEMQTMETYCTEFFDSEEGQLMLKEMRESSDNLAEDK